MLALVFTFASHPLTAARRFRPCDHGRGSLPQSASWLAVLGLTTTVGTLTYLLFLLATAAKVTGPVVIGRPTPWLVLQLLALATVAATAAVAFTWRRRRRDLRTADQTRLGLLTAGGLLFLAWAAYWRLLVP